MYQKSHNRMLNNKANKWSKINIKSRWRFLFCFLPFFPHLSRFISLPVAETLHCSLQSAVAVLKVEAVPLWVNYSHWNLLLQMWFHTKITLRPLARKKKRGQVLFFVYFLQKVCSERGRHRKSAFCPVTETLTTSEFSDVNRRFSMQLSGNTFFLFRIGNCLRVWNKKNKNVKNKCG